MAKRCTVNVSSRPSLKLAAASGWLASSLVSQSFKVAKSKVSIFPGPVELLFGPLPRCIGQVSFNIAFLVYLATLDKQIVARDFLERFL
jgi:hypothetical protein